MKLRKRFFDYLKNEQYDIQERIFALSAAIGLAGLILSFIGAILVGEQPVALIFVALSFMTYSTVVYLGYRFRRVKVAARVISFLVIFIFMPLTFFTSGGVYGGTPLWCLFCIIYAGMITDGLSRVFFLIGGVIVTITCWYIGYHHPEYVVAHTTDTVYTDSIGSLYLVGIILLALILFQTYLYRRENQLSEKRKKEIEELSEAQSRFFSSISHEIRTPINTIIGLNEMILRENVSKEINEDAVNIQSAGRMLLHLINDILDMSKISSGQMELVPQTYRTGDMLSDIVGMIWNRASEKGLDFTVDVSPQLPMQLMGDEVRIKQILINLLNNAIKYTSKGSVTFSISCAPVSDSDGACDSIKMICSVTDTGMGIKQESIPYLFDAYRRVDEDKNRYIEGTGLGLSIVKQLVDMMGGTISVNSIYTRGSSFVVEIPQKVMDPTPIGELDPLADSGMKNNDYTYRQSFEAPDARILVVDDTAANLLVVTKLLRPVKVQITTAGSGQEALEKTLTEYFDVIFMDHMMPVMDGIECMHAIRNQTVGKCRESRIVIFTANAGSEHRVRYVKEGFDGYLVKPVTGEAIESELYRQLPEALIHITGDVTQMPSGAVSPLALHKDRSLFCITTESVADMPAELIEKYRIAVIPYKIIADKGVFLDGTEIEAKGALAYSRSENAQLYSQPPEVEEYEAFFAKQLESSFKVIHIALSGNIGRSGCRAATIASRSFENVTVIDSKQMAGGHGFLTLEAGRMASRGASYEEVVTRIDEMSRRMTAGFITEDPEYLVKAGQVHVMVARMAQAFMLRPSIRVKNGRMIRGEFLPGEGRRLWRAFIRASIKKAKRLEMRRFCITYTQFSKEELDYIKKIAASEGSGLKQEYICQSSAAISVNAGPRSFGIYFLPS